MSIVDRRAWGEFVELNTDPYGKACVDVAREAMMMLDNDEEFSRDIDTHRLIVKADERACAGGITGFMAGCVAHMITVCHDRGLEFQSAWNSHYGVTSDEGVVNPAILTIGQE